MMLHYIPSRLIPTSETLTTNFWESILNLELRSLAFVAVNCFILISGYFGIKWKLQSFSSLIYRILFWSLIAYLFAVIFSPIIIGEPFNYTGNIPGNIFTWRWFIGAYLCLYIFAPVLNSFVDNVSQKQLGIFIAAFYSFGFIFGWILKSPEFNEGMSMTALAGLYLIGRYIRKYNLKALTLNLWLDLAIYLGIGIILVLLSVIALKLNFTKSLYGYMDPLVVIQSIYLFLFFKKLKMANSKTINLIAASAFSVYLFHDDICNREIWKYLCNTANGYGPGLSLFIMICGFALIFIICIIFDQIGNYIFKNLFHKITSRLTT